MKTNHDPEEDLERIQRIKDFRKLFSDTMILTTHFLKRCTKVPKIKNKPSGLSPKQGASAATGIGTAGPTHP